MTMIETALERIIIDLLSDRIIERMQARSQAKARSALLVFGQTDLGLQPALEQLRALGDAGWSFETVGAPSLAETGLDAAEATGDIGDMLARHALVLVPALSISLAAKVSLGIADDPTSALLQGALERGCRIVAARDGVCPNGRDRRERGLLPAPAYARTMSGHLQTLADYGIELSWAARLAATVTAAKPVAASAPAPVAASAGVFGWREARGFQGEELRLGRNVLVTPLAAEELRNRAIRLVKE